MKRDGEEDLRERRKGVRCREGRKILREKGREVSNECYSCLIDEIFTQWRMQKTIGEDPLGHQDRSVSSNCSDWQCKLKHYN